ncbi:hypothetical protein TanjilG_02288 [Lupinus angustifolius]|uniref:BHLH domain-containing protein n=1 Tax=Lupinus angustifolius TaxID=3871 RepID=A0A4P1QQK6_LUPAN|nr:PREDICTED: transcription factor bHLH95-like [Lupinus angustifolius]OIV92525.1 hypothetical protein TanjilG_02288 [Lupinus angustifolius]
MEDHSQHEKGFLLENHNLGFSNSDNSDKSNKKLKMKPLRKGEEGYEREGFVKKKPMHEVYSGSSENKISVGEENVRKSHETYSEMHLRIERERRKKMRNMYSTLRALIPKLPSKVDQITIVSEAMNYIKSLEQTLEMLEKQKQERLQTNDPFKYESSMINSRDETCIGNNGSCNNLVCAMSSNPKDSTSTLIPQHLVAFQTWCSPNVVLNICGNKAQLCIYTTKNLELLTTIAFVLDKHNIEVIAANIWCNDNGKGCMILAQTNVVSSHQFPEATLVEQIYKQATEEIKRLIS